MVLSVRAPASVITAVLNGASFQPGIVPGSWVTIKGENLSRSTRTWRPEEIVGGALPTSLDGVRVTISGRPAYVYFISPNQINVQAPTDDYMGSGERAVVVQVNSPDGVAYNTAIQKRVSPGLFTYRVRDVDYAAAVHSDGTLVGDPDLVPGANVRPVRPGDNVLLFATGLGLDTETGTPPGQVVSSPAQLPDSADVRIGGVPATVLYSGLVGVGLFQVNIVVPSGVQPGDAPVMLGRGGVWCQSAVFLPVENQEP
jgi:uncharacterized protein (TIGR03437 family)